MNDPIVIAGAFMSALGVITYIVLNMIERHNKKERHTH